MTHLIKFAFWFGVGYFAMNKVLPAIQARIEAADLDRMWEVWNDID